MTKKIMVLAVVLLFAVPNARAPEVVDGDTNSWFLLLSRLNISGKWSITNELHERTGSFLKDQGQFLWRPSLDYHLNDNVEFSIGYTFIHVSPYAPYNQPISKNEHNVWEQALLKWSVGKVKFQNRFRQENRWVDRVVIRDGKPGIDGTDFANRFRYRFTATFDIYRWAEGERSIFFNSFDELWLNQDDQLRPSSFARNWLYLGLGYKFDTNTNVQVGYMHQYDKVGADRYVSSPIVQLTMAHIFNL